jgi:hypothetical protein
MPVRGLQLDPRLLTAIKENHGLNLFSQIVHAQLVLRRCGARNSKALLRDDPKE